MRDHVDGAAGRGLKVIVQLPMRTVEGALVLRVEAVEGSFRVIAE
jgi:hypothetical protein